MSLTVPTNTCHQAEKVQNLITHTSNIRPAIKNKPIFSWTEFLSTFTSSFVLARIPANYLHLIHGIIIFSVMLAWWYFFPLVLLDHHQHALLKGRGCGTAHLQMRCHPETKSKVRSRKKIRLEWMSQHSHTWSGYLHDPAAPPPQLPLPRKLHKIPLIISSVRRWCILKA